jgi:hypothetical protein
MIRNLKTIVMLATVLAAMASSTALAESLVLAETATENLSLHNAGLPADVDANGAVDVTDLNLVFDVLRAHEATPLVAPLASEASYLWDTSGNGRVNSQDALVVINYLLTAPVPEPTTVISAGLALAGFAGFCWRRRRTAISRT